MDRVMADCRRLESDRDCQLAIIGPEDDVVAAAAEHPAASHGHEDTPELHEQLRAMLEPESAYAPGERTPVPFPRLIWRDASWPGPVGRGSAASGWCTPSSRRRYCPREEGPSRPGGR